jgi:Arc/MetJ-type ribon-helix-helix transcriptional regulator
MWYIVGRRRAAEDREMKVELTPDAANWVRDVVATGRFATAEDAARFAINEAKRAELRAMLEASEAEGGAYSSEEVLAYVNEELDKDFPATGAA